MNKTSKNQKGFSVVEVVLVIVIVVLIGVVGWFVYKHHHESITATFANTSANSTSSPTTLPTGKIAIFSSPATYTYPGRYFTLSYPSTWTRTSASALQPGALPTALAISPPSAPSGEEIGVVAYRFTSLSNALAEVVIGVGTTIKDNQSLKIGGYDAMYQQIVLKTSNSEVFDCYAITNGEYTVVLSFEVSYQGISSASIPGFNATNLLPQFNAIVESLKF